MNINKLPPLNEVKNMSQEQKNTLQKLINDNIDCVITDIYGQRGWGRNSNDPGNYTCKYKKCKFINPIYSCNKAVMQEDYINNLEFTTNNKKAYTGGHSYTPDIRFRYWTVTIRGVYSSVDKQVKSRSIKFGVLYDSECWYACQRVFGY